MAWTKHSNPITGNHGNAACCDVFTGDQPLDDGIATALTLMGFASPKQEAAEAAVEVHSVSSSSSSSVQSPSAEGFTCLAWLIKGLSMAGHAAGLHLVGLPLSYLHTHQTPPSDPQLQPQQRDVVNASSSSHTDGCGDANQSGVGGAVDGEGVQQHPAAAWECIQAAAATFEVVLSDQDSVLSLSRDLSHVKVKLIWQQRFYTAVLQQLEKLLATAPRLAAKSSTDEQPPTKGTTERQQGPLLLALAYLLKGTPAKLSKADLPRLVGTLLTALDVLQLPGQCRDKGVLTGLSESVQAVMKDPTGMCPDLEPTTLLI